jgi:hypothetical protein
MKKLFIILTVVMIATTFLSADVYIKQVTRTNMQGQEKEMVQEQWMSTDKIATISAGNSIILDMGKKKFYMIQHAAKTYVESNLPLDMTELMPEQMASMMKTYMSGMSVSVQPNGQTKQIGNWNAKGYDFTITAMGMPIKMIMWASSDVPFDWKKYQPLSAEVFKATMRMGEQFIQELEKLEGYPIATDMEMMGVKVEMKVEEISQKTPSTNVYAVPAGYTKKARLGMGDMQQ